ncbi:hypothetical protein BOX15_Mlig021368g14 [Macrostomum lignano]|uniref:THAP-type domain-containing protein n=1 Tax=Macrostomum lignano TaxID=282301 RepID=A0A267GCB0_9PLAT|nr:hypothetical protein BOX15_Mlig021368g14 [Macrostomum lignano]
MRGTKGCLTSFNSLARMKSTRKCSALGCNSVQRKGSVSFFAYPIKQPSLLSEWLCHVETTPGFAPTSCKYLCELHFSAADIAIESQGAKSPGRFRKRLRPGVAPNCEWKVDPPVLEPADPPVLEPADPPVLEPAEESASTEPPVLHRFDEDPTFEEQRISAADAKRLKNKKTLSALQLLRRKLSRRLASRARRYALAKQRSRKLKTFELKLLAADQALQRAIEQRKDSELAMKQFRCLLTAKGKSLLSNPIREKAGAFSEEVRRFASELHYCSPRAYANLRRYFRLPADETIRRWNRFECQAGVTAVSIEKVKELCSESVAMRDWALVIDAMHIRREICVNVGSKRFSGFADVGAGSNCSDDQELAREAVVLLAVGLRSSWKLPVAYILPNSAKPAQQAHLISRTIEELNSVGAVVRALVCDCAAVNLATVKLFGASIPEAPSFTISSQQQRVHVFFDNCHLLKLVRNSLSDLGCFVHNGSSISWRFIELLHSCQQAEGGRLGNRLSTRHIEWKRLSMKVSLAAQTLSSSVADALQFLQDAGCPEFQDCGATVRFIRTIDSLFDVFNSR